MLEESPKIWSEWSEGHREHVSTSLSSGHQPCSPAIPGPQAGLDMLPAALCLHWSDSGVVQPCRSYYYNSALVFGHTGSLFTAIKIRWFLSIYRVSTDYWNYHSLFGWIFTFRWSSNHPSTKLTARINSMFTNFKTYLPISGLSERTHLI